MPNKDIEERVARHLAFWALDSVDRPLLGANVDLASERGPLIYQVAAEGDILGPEQCVRADPFPAFREQQDRLAGLDTDLFRPAAPLLAGLQLEAAIGMPLKVAGGSIWPMPLLSETEPLENLHVTVRDEWVDAAVRGIDRLAGQCGGRYPLMGPFMRAPADMLTALIGTSRACIELEDHPDETLAIIERLADAWRRVATLLQSRVPAWEGGFVLSAANGIYAPGPAAVFSEDSTVLVSLATYRRFFLPADRRLSRTFPYGMVHRHAASQQNIAGLLEIDRNWLIQITMDQMGPTVGGLMPVFHQLQAAGRPIIVYLYGMRTDPDPEEQIAALARELSPRGLCIIVHTDDLDRAAQFVRLAKGMRWRDNGGQSS